jgi:hypothetical protein
LRARCACTYGWARGLKPARRPAENTPQEPFERTREMYMATTSPMPSGAPVLRRIAVLLGWLSLLATLALLSPGIVATANADEPTAAGPACPISREADEHTAADLSQMIERLRSQVAEREGDAGDVVSLNTRGFNYGPTATPRPPTERRDPQ